MTPARVALAALGLAAGMAGAPALADEGEVRAQVAPVRATVLSSEIAGRIAELAVREGERFRKGETLVVFDCALHRARLAKAEAQLDEARKTHAVNARLDKLGSISTLEVDVAAARMAAAAAEAQLMRAIVERCAVRAPFAGRVAEAKVRGHQYVGEGQELLDILDDGEWEIEMIVPSRWLAWLREGHQFSLTVEETGATLPAVVSRLGARVDPVSQSVRLFGRLTGEAPGLVAGMSGTAKLTPP